ncbi:MAG: class I SAM-dependent methyltransferase [Desulfovibrionaceae bacterium]
MQLNDIHEKEFVEKVHALLDEDMKRLVAMKDDFVFSSCPGCLSHEATPAYELSGLQAHRCAKCSLVYINPRPTVQVMHAFFEQSEGFITWFNQMPEKLRAKRAEMIYRKRFDTITGLREQYGIAGDVVLEVGGGDGSLSTMLADSALFEKIFVLEPLPLEIPSPSVEVVRATVEEAALPGNAGSLAIAFEVLEHLLEPRVFFDKMHSFLKPGGCLYLTTPNYDGFEIGVLKTQSTSIGYDHLNIFNPRSLQAILDAFGFDAVALTTPGRLDLQMIRARYVEGALDLDDNPALRYIVTDGWEANAGPFQDWLVARNGSSHMACLARKRG